MKTTAAGAGTVPHWSLHSSFHCSSWLQKPTSGTRQRYGGMLLTHATAAPHHPVLQCGICSCKRRILPSASAPTIHRHRCCSRCAEQKQNPRSLERLWAQEWVGEGEDEKCAPLENQTGEGRRELEDRGGRIHLWRASVTVHAAQVRCCPHLLFRRRGKKCHKTYLLGHPPLPSVRHHSMYIMVGAVNCIKEHIQFPEKLVHTQKSYVKPRCTKIF